MQFRDSKTGKFVSKQKYQRSRSQGGRRYKRVNVKKNREYLIFLFDDPETKKKRKDHYLSDHKEGDWAQVVETSEETKKIAQEKLGERSRSPRILVIYHNKVKGKKTTDRMVINFCINWILKHAPEWEFITWELTAGTRQIVVARGKLVNKKVQVILGNA